MNNLYYLVIGGFLSLGCELLKSRNDILFIFVYQYTRLSIYVFCKLNGTNNVVPNICLQLGQLSSNIKQNILPYSKAFSSFQFVIDTRSSFSFLFPTIFSTIVWDPGTLIYSVPKHFFDASGLCFCICSTLQCHVTVLMVQIPFPSRLYSKSLPLGVLQWLHLPRRPFPSSPTFSNPFLHSLI